MKKQLLLLVVLSVFLLGGCTKVPKNTVFCAADLEGKTIGVELGTTGDAYASEIKDTSIQRFNKGIDAINALAQGELDAVVLDEEPAKHFVRDNDALCILDDPFAQEEYALAVKKGNKELLDQINGALDTLKEDGTLERIKEGWLEKDGTTVVYDGQNKENYANGTLVMATNAEFPPYESVQGEEIVGIDVDIMKAVCDRLDMKLEIENITFDSIFAALDKGNVDVGAAAITITDERKEKIDFSQAYATSKQVIIVRKK